MPLSAPSILYSYENSSEKLRKKGLTFFMVFGY
jgi:hypothetical protein